jgi:ABC-type Fe3+-hydroxamate transport system substrate-binding protein
LFGKIFKKEEKAKALNHKLSEEVKEAKKVINKDTFCFFFFFENFTKQCRMFFN